MSNLEKKLIAELMVDSSAYDTFAELASALDAKLFQDKRNRLIYAAIKKIYSDGGEANSVTVAAELDSSNQLDDAGGYQYIATIDGSEISGAFIQHTTRSLIDVYHRNRMKKIAMRLIQEIDTTSSIDNIAEKVIGEMQSVLEKGSVDQTMTIGQTVKIVTEEYEKMIDGSDSTRAIPTGILALDERLTGGGVKNGHVVLIGARPSTGKSNVAFNFVVNMSEQGYSVGLISAEMDAISVTERSMACVGGFDDSKLSKGRMSAEDEAKFYDAAKSLEGRKVVVSDTPSPTITQVEVLAKKWKRERHIDVLIIDYLQYIKPDRSSTRQMNREQEVAQVSNRIKELARKLKIPIIVMAQLNRSHEHANQIPKLSDIRESGSTEQDADVVVLLHSFEAVNVHVVPEQFKHMAGQPTKDLVLFLLEKQRRGVRKVSVFVRFDKQTGRMTSIDTRHLMEPLPAVQDMPEYNGKVPGFRLDNSELPF